MTANAETPRAVADLCLLIAPKAQRRGQVWDPAKGDALEPQRCRDCDLVLRWKTTVRDQRKRGGRKALCRDCQVVRDALRDPAPRREYAARYYEKNAEAISARRTRYRRTLATRSDKAILAARLDRWPHGEKPCRSCGEILPLDRYSWHRREVDGLQQSCINCDAQRDALRRRGGYVDSWEHRDVLGSCWICGGDGFDESGPLALNVEHVLPITRGGPDEPALTRAAHARCNYWKGTRDALDVVEELHPGLLDRLGSLPVVEVSLDG